MLGPLMAALGLALVALATLGGTVVAATGAQAEALRAGVSFQEIGISPAKPVVARAPLAVSVTFSQAPDPGGVSLRIFGPEGEVSAAQPQLAGHAIRRSLDQNLPGGRYEVRWTARGPGGEQLTGSFAFIAARGNGVAAPEAGPSVTPEITSAASPAMSPDRTPAGSPASSPARIPAGVQDAGSAGGGGGTGLPEGLVLVPLTVGAALVLASAAVGLLSRPRRKPLFVHRGLALPWHRHQQ